MSSFELTVDCVLEGFSRLKSKKSDGSGLDSSHFIKALPVIVEFISSLFTIIVRHGHLPSCLRDCILVPIPKPGKDFTCGDNYRPIALASTLSKVLEWCILLKFESCFQTSDLQFGFKPGLSTTLCTGVLKSVVSRYLQRGSSVFACFLDASKAFDLVKHSILFKKLIHRGLPDLVVRLLSRWYSSQELCVRWSNVYSDKFGVSNGVRQGGVLSPVLFSIYLDSLLLSLKNTGVGCFWGDEYTGALAYADDVALLAPSLSAMRLMLQNCELFAASHGIQFNPSKTKFIQFFHHSSLKISSDLLFCGQMLPVVSEVVHLGHILTHNLSDDKDIHSKCRDMVRKAMSLFCCFPNLSPIVLTFLFRSFCLSLYGSALWFLSSRSLSALEIAFNKLLRRIWKLPYNSHTRVVHCTAKLHSLYNSVYDRSATLFKSSQTCSSKLVKYVFYKSAKCCFTFLGFNVKYGQQFCKDYSSRDLFHSDVIRDLRIAQPFLSIQHNLIESVVTSLSTYTT